jgi:hypothetical protein
MYSISNLNFNEGIFMMTEKNSDRPAFEPRMAIGVFLSVFGLAVIGAAFMEMPAADRMINLIAGLAILVIGAASFFLGMRKAKRGAPDKDEEADEGP